jgi:hypothetical protein
MKMLPQFNQTCASSRLNPTQYKMLQIVVMLLQFHKTVTIERLATVFPQPIKDESRRRSLPRFLSLPQLSIQLLWFPLLNQGVKIRKLKQGKRLTFAIDRTQGRDQNIFGVSLSEDKRAIPIYWQSLPKKGWSNLPEQKALIRPLLRLVKGYRILGLKAREFHSVKLANCLHTKRIDFGLRQKQGRYIRL